MLRKLASLSPREWSDLFRAQMALVRAAWKLRSVRLGELVSAGGRREDARAGDARGEAARGGEKRPPEARPPDPHNGVEALRARELALALQRVAEHGPVRAQCLVRSMALSDLLQREGVPGSEIRVGVQKKGDELLAHAWVELNGIVLGDQVSHVSRFVPIEGLRVNQ